VNVVLFGVTGMVGAGVLIECLDDPRVESVLAVGRRPCAVAHPKLRELIRSDLFDYRDAADHLSHLDACFFCLGVSAVGMSEAGYHRLTYDLTIAAAESLLELNPELTFCHVTGGGTDSTEQGRLMWACVKGKTENQLLRMTPNAYMFRPGYIQPLRGVHHRARVYRVLHVALRPFYSLLLPKHGTTTVNIGRAMIRVAAQGHTNRVLENPNINSIAVAV
jgi:uncharacterized protein YbjT (DUF2867 family)